MNDYTRSTYYSIVLALVSAGIILAIFAWLTMKNTQLKDQLEEAEKCCKIDK